MGSYRDTMQVCLNGHVINDRYNKSIEFRKKFCTQCGAKTITNCPNCNTNIPGDLIIENTFSIPSYAPTAPKICANCGKNFPWIEAVKMQEEEEMKQFKIDQEEKKMSKKLSNINKIEVKIDGHGNIISLGSMIDNVITNTLKLSNAGDKNIAIALEKLTSAITESDINNKDKQQYIEQLNFLSEEALKPIEKRAAKSVLQPIINYGLGTLKAAGSLAEIWGTWGETIKSFFLG